jgi:hypothetical protein
LIASRSEVRLTLGRQLASRRETSVENGVAQLLGDVLVHTASNRRAKVR